MGKNFNCELGLLEAFKRWSGGVVDEEKLNSHFGNDSHAKATYARASQRYAEDLAEDALKNIPDNPAIKFMEGVGIPAKNFYSYLASPEAILGKDVVNKIEQVYLKHVNKNGVDLDNWKTSGAQEIKAIRQQFESQVPEHLKDYASKYFDRHERGGQFYTKANASPLTRLMRNAVGNLVTWNPMITTLNVFEFAPKALAYAVEKAGPVQGPAAVIKAFSSYMQKTGGQFWKRIPEYESMGVYGGSTDHPLSKWNLLNLTENPLRGLSVEVDKALGGSGTEGLEKIAFVNRFGNEPMSALDFHGTEALALMRYSLASTKMYIGLLNRARQGNVNAIGALAAFSAMTAMQTGSASAIPVPLYNILPDEQKEALSEFDNALGGNWAKRAFGTDLKSSIQPLSMPALGAGYSILSQDVAGGLNDIRKGVVSAEEQDYTAAATQILEGTMGLGLTAKIPGVNLTTKRLAQSIGEALRGEIEDTPSGVLEDFAVKTKLYQEPEE